VEFVKGLFAAGREMDKEALLAALPGLIAQTCDPEIEWYEDPQRADARVYRGHSGVRESWERWLDQWDEWFLGPPEFAALYAYDTVRQRRRWYRNLVAEGLIEGPAPR
jgi:hypothetical protein